MINGERDPFGIPDEADASRVVVLPGETHTLSRNPQAVQAAVAEWLGELPRTAGGPEGLASRGRTATAGGGQNGRPGGLLAGLTG